MGSDVKLNSNRILCPSTCLMKASSDTEAVWKSRVSYKPTKLLKESAKLFNRFCPQYILVNWHQWDARSLSWQGPRAGTSTPTCTATVGSLYPQGVGKRREKIRREIKTLNLEWMVLRNLCESHWLASYSTTTTTDNTPHGCSSNDTTTVRSLLPCSSVVVQGT